MKSTYMNVSIFMCFVYCNNFNIIEVKLKIKVFYNSILKKLQNEQKLIFTKNEEAYIFNKH